MPRNIPACPPEKPNPARGPSHTYTIELITPMFGGGVEPRVNDTTFPIRPTAIRGQLQFWWRATVGAQYATLTDLRAAQSNLWGSTERASRVQVVVENVQASEPVPCARYEKQGDKFRSMPFWNSPFSGTALPYALFPFQGRLSKSRTQIEEKPSLYIARATAQLVIHCPADLWSQVEPAVWAWVNFGGLGGRTRRGCGAILCRELAPQDHAQLIEQFRRLAPCSTEECEWPTVAECMLLRTTESPDAPVSVWDWLMGRFRHFRQGEGLGRNPRGKSPTPGRSRYPEPETIRHVTKRRWSQHPRQEKIPEDAFPRAEFGLPIVFHFKDEREGEPDQTVLYPADSLDGTRRERMASPLILKPLALADGKAIPLILRLKTLQLTGVDLRRGNTSLPLLPSTIIRGERLSAYQNSPLNLSQFAKNEGRDKIEETGSALEAFLAFARSEGFTEVQR